MSTAGTLRTQIQSYLHTSEFTDDETDEFIRVAEQRIGRDCRLVENYITSTETPSSGVVTLPTRMAQLQTISRGSGSTLVVLQQVPDTAKNRFGSSGKAQAFSVSDAIYLYPGADDDVDITYWEHPESLDGAAAGATRPILTRYEGLYLNAALAEASLYLRDYEAAAAFETRYYAEVERANAAARQLYRPRASSPYNWSAASVRGV